MWLQATVWPIALLNDSLQSVYAAQQLLLDVVSCEWCSSGGRCNALLVEPVTLAVTPAVPESQPHCWFQQHLSPR